MKPNKIKIIGLTGGIGTGKSTVAGLLKARGVAIIDADEISKRLVSQKGPLLDALTQTVGPRILDAAGNFDRKKTADLVFGDHVALSQLQVIMHKHIAVQMKADVQKLKGKGIRLVVLDVPLPVKEGFLDLCDAIWVVDAALELRIARLMVSRGYTREECLRRMECQRAPAAYLALADVVLDNNAGVPELETQVADALRALH